MSYLFLITRWETKENLSEMQIRRPEEKIAGDSHHLKLNFNHSFRKWKVKVKLLSRFRFFVTPRTVAHQAPPSMGFARQEYGSGLPFPFPGYLPNLAIEPRSPKLQAGTFTSEPPGKPNYSFKYTLNLVGRWTLLSCLYGIAGDKNKKRGTALVVQWLGVYLPVQGTWVQALIKELGFYMLQGN